MTAEQRECIHALESHVGLGVYQRGLPSKLSRAEAEVYIRILTYKLSPAPKPALARGKK